MDAQLLHHYKIPIGLGIVSVMSIVIAVFSLYQFNVPTKPIDFVMGDSTSSGELRRRTIVIDIEGAVGKPGVYTLDEGARVEDAIISAGGLTPNASKKLLEQSINRAQKIVDGAKLYIPSVDDEKKSTGTLSNTSHNINSNQTGSVININSAPQEALESLPGVGPATATKIIAGRPYMTLEELVSKKAIGKALFEKIKATIAL